MKKKNWLFLLSSAWEIRKSIFIFYGLNIVLMLAFSITAIIAPRELISALMNKVGENEVIKIALIFFVVSGISSFFMSYIKGFITTYLHEIRVIHLHRIFTKILTLDYSHYEDAEFLNKIWVIESAVNTFKTGVQGVLMRLFQISASMVTIIFYFGVLFRVSTWVTLFLSINIIIVFFTTFYSYKFSLKMQHECSPYDRKGWYLNRILHDFAFGKDIRVYGISNWLVDMYKQNFTKRNSYTKRVETKNYQASIITTVLSFIRDILIYGTLVNSVINGRIDIADFTMYFIAVASFTVIMQEISTDIAFVHSQEERISEYRKFLELPDEAEKSGSLHLPSLKNNGYEIELRDIWFKYPKSDKYIYKNLNLTIRSGEKLAIVGLNGAGKTTLIKLIIGLYQPQKGEILLNGVNIKDLDLVEYRKIISAVFQEITLFATILAENLTQERGQYNEVKLSEAMKESGFFDVYKNLKGGMDTQVLKYIHEEGIDFSGGEKQKIAITRALYKDGSILIFDEPTAALDAVAEYNLYQQLAQISLGKTVIFISHRLASTRFCDRIVLIGDGGISEIGTHDELMGQQGKYCGMFTTQAQYYKEDGENNE